MLGFSLLFSVLAQAAPGGSGTHVLIVAGLGGEPKYEQEFFTFGKQLADAARTKYGIPDSLITFLAEKPERDAKLINGAANKEEIGKAFAKIKGRVKPGDLVFVVLIGHGASQDPRTSTFNIIGDDITAADFAKLLAPLAKQQVVFVNTASASGDFAGTLAGPNRVIITSTLSPMERNYAKFAKYFAAAYGDKAADADKDKNGRVSMLEAFEYSRRAVERDYSGAQLLQSEHAMIEDDGDGKGTPEPGLEWLTSDGRMAARVFLNGTVAEDPRVTALFTEHRGLLMKLDSLRGRQASMDSVAYKSEMRKVFVDLVVVGLKARQIWVGAK